MSDPAGGDAAPVVALVGPTGSGKSRIAMAAAGAAGAVIVAVDAFTVYRQMTVGTAKPSTADRAAVPHRMIDVLDVEQDCTVQWFQARARADIDAARADGRPVLLVGGSGLYFRAVVDPLQFPPTDADVRRATHAAVTADVAAAHARLHAADPDAAAKIDPSNVRRITRALEVIALTGRPFSSFATAWERHDPVYPGLRVVGLELDREDLVDRIHRRVDAMLAAGWLEECRDLLERRLSPTAAQAIGYAELMAHLREGHAGATGPEGLSEVAERIAIRTRQFARRQGRWFAGDPRVEWTDPAAAIPVVTAALAGEGQ